MSRFFAASDSESSSSSSDSEEENNFQQKKNANAANFFINSDDEMDTKRVVRSAKSKRYEQLQNIMKAIRNSKKIRDFNKMETSFQELIKAYDKARAVVMKEEAGVTPRFYVRVLVEMEDLINETWEDRDGRKSMSKNNSKSLSALRQKFRKYVRDFEEDIAKFRENPDADDDEEDAAQEDDEDKDSDADEANKFTKKTADVPMKNAFLKKSQSDDSEDSDDDDDSYWDNSSESESSSHSDEPGMTLRDTFRKKETTAVDKKAERKKKAKPKRTTRLDDEPSDEDDNEDSTWTKVERGVSEKPKMFDKDAEINHALVVKKLQEIMAARGKKRTDHKEQIELLKELLAVSEEHNLGVGIYIKIKFALVSAIFDYNPKISEAMKPEFWEKCLPALEELVDTLIANIDDVVASENINEESENVETKPYKIRGCFLSLAEKMCEDFVKILKSCDAHSNEYVIRLRDEPKIIEILEKTQVLVDKSESTSEMCRIYLKRIEHVYFKFDPNVVKFKNGELDADTDTTLNTMDRLCKYIYSKDSTDRLRTRAILCHIYHHSIHNNWYEARDLMLMSHLQDAVVHADPQTQILYNRTMVQLGLCGFRHAEIRDAHNALLDFQMGGRSKELLAQGLLPMRNNERSSEQEKIEKQRQMPFHMHINLEMLECVYLVCAMLIEIPYMAAHEYDARRRMISKYYYQQLRSSERQSLVGPPETMREHIVAASKAMRNGDWKKCKNLILSEKMNIKVWDLFHEADKVRVMLERKIQEESLRTYLFTYSKVYDSMSVETLAQMFELEKTKVHAIVSKMIINEELMASLDEPTECMVMHRTEPSRLQSLSLQLSDKISQLVDSNERLLEPRLGGWQNNWRSKDDRNGDRSMNDRNRNDGDRMRNDRHRDGNRNKSDRKYNNNHNGRNHWKSKNNARGE